MGTPAPENIRIAFCEALQGVEDRIYQDLLTNLNIRCEELNITQRELALILGKDQGTVNRYLNDKINFPSRMLVRMLLRLNLRSDVLHSTAYESALLKAYQATVIAVRKQQDPSHKVSIEEHEVAYLLESIPELKNESVSDEIASRVERRVHERFPSLNHHNVTASELGQLWNEWRSAWRVCLPAIFAARSDKQ